MKIENINNFHYFAFSFSWYLFYWYLFTLFFIKITITIDK
jgi:hypothetical protein